MSEVKEKSTIIKDTLILFAITLVAALLLGTVHEITKEPIKAAEAQAKIDAYKTVFPELVSTMEDEELSSAVAESGTFLAEYPELEGSMIDEALFALDEDGTPLGMVMTVTNKNGYGGAITFTIGVDFDGMMKGLEFLTISETPGLGMKAKDDKFTSQFKDVGVSQFALPKAGIQGDTQLDAISSATITSKAVTRGVNAGLRFAEYVRQQGIGGVVDE